MKLRLNPGKYLVAVSGGVDSVVLLDLLVGQNNLELIVVHFDHGTRPDIHSDIELVKSLAEKRSLEFIGAGANLGEGVSEEVARKTRYDFFEKVRISANADGIVLAHHKDDVLETVIYNILRGTGRKGITSLESKGRIIRPMLDYSKTDIKQYAKEKKLKWNEDSTNKDTKYSRNWIRLELVPKLSEGQKTQLLSMHKAHKSSNIETDRLLDSLIGTNNMNLDRQALLATTHDIAKEVIARWLRQNDLRQFDKKTIERIVHGAKTFKAGKTVDVYGKTVVKIDKKHLRLVKTAQ